MRLTGAGGAVYESDILSCKADAHSLHLAGVERSGSAEGQLLGVKRGM